jgi:hypothetical protein
MMMCKCGSGNTHSRHRRHLVGSVASTGSGQLEFCLPAPSTQVKSNKIAIQIIVVVVVVVIFVAVQHQSEVGASVVYLTTGGDSFRVFGAVLVHVVVGGHHVEVLVVVDTGSCAAGFAACQINEESS